MARTPIWGDIASALREDIGRGRYRPDDKLPTEAALASRFGVNRHTVRRALAALADDGLIHARRGSGVFVTARTTTYPIGRRVRFTAALEQSGQMPERRIHRLETRRADAQEAEALALPADSLVHVCEGIGLADGVPITQFGSAFPAERLPDLPRALRDCGSITAALARCGLADYVRVSTTISAHAATAVQANLLRIAEGAPLLRTVSLNADDRGRPVEFGRTWFVGERVQFTYGA